jgi:hypothetical protein
MTLHFTLHQWIVLAALKQWNTKKGYRLFIEELRVSKLVDVLKLKKIPCFSALQKVIKRLPKALFEYVMLGFFFLTRLRRVDAGGDGTGFRASTASSYYTACVERFKKKKRRGRRRKKRKIKKHIHPLLLIELRNQLILTALIRRGPLSEAPLIIPLLKKLKSLIGKLRKFLYDKAADAEYIHEFVNDSTPGKAIIPARNKEVPIHRTRGQYRKKMKRHFPEKDFKKRKRNETVNSVVKRLMGEEVLSVKWWMQDKELLLRFIAYNAYRISIIFLFIEILRGFLRDFHIEIFIYYPLFLYFSR